MFQISSTRGLLLFRHFKRLSPKQRDHVIEILCPENQEHCEQLEHFEHCEQLEVRYRLLKSRAQI